MTQINITVFPNAEAWLKENLEYMATDNIAAVYPTNVDADKIEATYFDEEEGLEKSVGKERHVEMLAELVRLISEEKLFVGGIKNPMDLTDTGNWDVEVADAYFQLLYHGEVIYG